MKITCLIIYLSIFFKLNAQDSISTAKALQWGNEINLSYNKIDKKLQKKLDKYLSRITKTESRILSKTESKEEIQKKNEAEINQILSDLTIGKEFVGTYEPFWDNNRLSLLYVSEKLSNKKLKEVTIKLKSVEQDFLKADKIQKALASRKEMMVSLQQKIPNKYLKKLNKDVYYLKAFINEYKKRLTINKENVKYAMKLLEKSNVVQNFIRKNSTIAQLFGWANATGNTTANLIPRNTLYNNLNSRFGNNWTEVVTTQIQTAQTKQIELKSILIKYKQSYLQNGEIQMPDFKVNEQKTKKFLKRIELGSSFEIHQKQNNLPSGSSLQFSVGYKLNDNSIIGIGGNYRFGLTKQDFKLRYSNENAGIRTFIDYRLKGKNFITGGFEKLYSFNTLIPNTNLGLLGATKKIEISNKYFKAMKIQLLYNFLTNKQNTPLIFRMGYTF